MLNLQDLLKGETKEVEVDGGTIVIKKFTIAEVNTMTNKKDTEGMDYLIATGVVDPVIPETEVKNMPVKVALAIQEELLVYNGMVEESEKK